MSAEETDDFQFVLLAAVDRRSKKAIPIPSLRHAFPFYLDCDLLNGFSQFRRIVS